MLRIQEAREAHGWTQERLANELGTTQQTVQRWETGAVDPKISKVVAISELLGVTVSYLLGTDMPLDQSLLDQSLIDHSITNEQRLVELYRALDDDTKKLVLDLLERLSK